MLGAGWVFATLAGGLGAAGVVAPPPPTPVVDADDASPSSQAGSGGTVAVLGLSVVGHVDDNATAELFASLRAGLRRGGFEVQPATAPPLPDDCDAPCRQQRLDATGADFLVSSTLEVDDRVYRLEVALIDDRGVSIVTSRGTCEVCGRSDAAEMVQSQGPRLRRRLDLLVQAPPVAAPTNVPPPSLDPANPGLADDGIGDEPARRDPAKTWGGVALGMGAALTVGGVVLLALHGRPYRSRCGPDDVDFAGRCRFEYDTLAGGLSALGVGVGLVATGVTWLVRSRRASRSRRSAHP